MSCIEFVSSFIRLKRLNNFKIIVLSINLLVVLKFSVCFYQNFNKNNKNLVKSQPISRKFGRQVK